MAGLIAGALIGALTVVTFAVVDNVWLGIVSQQQTKIDGFASSGAASMREHLNHSLIGPAVFFTVGLGVLGAALGGLGGFTERARLLPSWARAVRPAFPLVRAADPSRSLIGQRRSGVAAGVRGRGGWWCRRARGEADRRPASTAGSAVGRVAFASAAARKPGE